MKRTLFFASLSLALGLTACGDDPVVVANGDTGTATTDTGGGTAEPPAGAAYEAEVNVTGGPAEGTSTGSTETAAAGQFHATVFQGELAIFLTTGDTGSAMIISAGIDTSGAEVPGSFTVTPTLEGTWFNATLASATAAGIFGGTGGSITVDFCPNDVGAVVAGTFNNVTTTDEITGGDGGTFNGEWRATVVQSDGSITCAAPVVEPPADTGTPSGECSVDPEQCDGPVCPYAEFVQNCLVENCFALCQNPMEFEACFACTGQCAEDSGIQDDAEALRLATAVDDCSGSAGCDDLEDDAYDACLIANCCAEVSAAYN